MLSRESNAGDRWKTTIGLIRKKATLHAQHACFVHFFTVVLHDYVYNVKLPQVTRFSGEMSYMFSFTSFSLPLIFTLVAATFSPFVTTATKFSCFSSNQKMSPLFVCLFFISRSRSLSPFCSLSFAGLPPTFRFSPSFSFSIFQIRGHDN